MLVRCSDCHQSYRAKKDSDYAKGGVCFRCQHEQYEADREQAAAMAMSVRVFGTNDPDRLLEM